MINVIMDLNNLAYRSLFIVGGYGSKQYTFDNQYEIDQFIRKMSTDVSYIIRQINPSRVLFALDSKSWRKDISIDENEGYKGNREKSGNINWDNVFNTIKEFGEILNSNGFIVTKIETAEADDIISLWRDELVFNQKQHVIIVSADEDVRQLILSHPHDNKRIFSTVFNPFATGKSSSKKLYVPSHFNEWLATPDVGDIFNRAIDVDKQDFTRLRYTEKIIVEEVDGNSIALRKIFCGDDGDNVPAIYSWIVKDKNGEDKVVRITNSKSQKIIDLIGAKDYKDLLEKSNIVYDQIENICDHKPSFNKGGSKQTEEEKKKYIDERLWRQIKLVVLSKEVFPQEIVKDFNDKLQEELNRPNVHPQDWNMNSILEGTRYVRNKGTESSIFKEIDRINTLF